MPPWSGLFVGGRGSEAAGKGCCHSKTVLPLQRAGVRWTHQDSDDTAAERRGPVGCDCRRYLGSLHMLHGRCITRRTGQVLPPTIARVLLWAAMERGMGALADS